MTIGGSPVNAWPDGTEGRRSAAPRPVLVTPDSRRPRVLTPEASRLLDTLLCQVRNNDDGRFGIGEELYALINH